MTMHPMNQHRFVLLFLFALSIRLLMAIPIRQPGYMDTAYYAVQGIQFAEGAGAQEPYLWNYLTAPDTVPYPAFSYWMPLPALLVAPFWAIGRTFWAIQIPFAILSAVVVVLGAHLAWQLVGSRRHYWTAGALLTFGGVATPFLTLPETFTPFALWGLLCLWFSGCYWQSGKSRLLVIAGVAAVFAYLTRSDGLLLLLLVLALPLCRREGVAFLVTAMMVVLLLTPWFVYNLQSHGWLLPTSGAQTLWLTNYDDLYCYKCNLSFHTYLAWGWPAILQSKLKAFGTNFMILIFNLGFVSLTPLAVIGGWRLRRQPIFTVAWFYLLLLFATMTLAFTFPGSRGSLMHSLVALLPFSVGAIVVGLDAVIAWASAKRGWNIKQAQIVFSVSALVVAVVVTGNAWRDNLRVWADANLLYYQIGDWLERQPDAACPVLVSDPPSFWYATRRASVVVPNENPTIVLEVAQRYGVCWLLLDQNRPHPLQHFYEVEQSEGWQLAYSWKHGKLFQRVKVELAATSR